MDFINVERFLCEILEVDGEDVHFLCLVDKENKITQERVMNSAPLIGFINLEVGKLMEIIITTKKGSITHEFVNVSDDLYHYFEKEDIFKGLEGTAFFNEN